MKRILSIDGGGIRVFFQRRYWRRWKKTSTKPLSEYFDLISGTSTGGIIALGLALGLSAKDILALYEEEGPAIFSQANQGLRGTLDRALRSAKWLAWGPKHDSKKLKEALTTTFGDKRLW